MSSKQCIRCAQHKPLDAYYRHPQMRGGRLNKCIECAKADVRENRLAKIDYYRQYDRERANIPKRVQARLAYQQTESFRLSHAVSSKRWEVANALRKKAITAVGNAIRDGKLKREPCLVCGEYADAHHPDYAAPLAVSWLCRKHHLQLHREHRAYLRNLKAAP